MAHLPVKVVKKCQALNQAGEIESPRMWHQVAHLPVKLEKECQALSWAGEIELIQM